MAYSINQVILSGNVGNDPMKAQTDKATIVNFSLATSKKVNDLPITQWHNCVAFGKTAEAIIASVKRGSKLVITGEIKYEKFTNKDGIEKTATKIIVNTCAITLSVAQEGHFSDDRDRLEGSAKSLNESFLNSCREVSPFPGTDLDSDIPF